MDRVVLTASEGMYYTDGHDGGKVVYLAEGATADDWYEVPEEEFLAAVEQGIPYGQISDAEALQIITGGAQ